MLGSEQPAAQNVQKEYNFMQHLSLRGSHREAGFQWGTYLSHQRKFLPDIIPFPISKARLAFATACLPTYRRYFPTILEEIEGIALAQNCDPELLQAVLFSMYALPPELHCSCFAISQGGQVLLGRNSDFYTALEEENKAVEYRLSGSTPAVLGHTTAFAELEDGVNAHGLAAGLTAVCPTVPRPGLNAGLLLRLLLETCRSVEEAVTLIRGLPLASAQTLTLADASGRVALVECCPERTEVCFPSPERPFVCAVNEFHLTAMQSFRRPVPDNWQSEERYQTMDHALDRSWKDMDANRARELLAGRQGFLCQYGRETGHDTVWSVVYDLSGGTLWRAEGNPSRCPFRPLPLPRAE